jgi:phosphatidylglycerophosphate synthase
MTSSSPAPWDARLARRLVQPLVGSAVTPNQLTTLRLVVGLAGAACFTRGTYGACNLGAVLICLSNFLDHADGELARLTGRSSRGGHVYDLVSDAVVTISLFVSVGIGIGAQRQIGGVLTPVFLGALAGAAIALIFFLRLRIEEHIGKAGTQQATLAGFETEDALYTLPLLTLFGATVPLLLVAAVLAPLFAIWVVIDYRRKMRIPVSQPRERQERQPQTDPG